MMNKISFEKSSHNIESEVLSESRFDHASSSHTNYYEGSFDDNKNVENASSANMRSISRSTNTNINHFPSFRPKLKLQMSTPSIGPHSNNQIEKVHQPKVYNPQRGAGPYNNTNNAHEQTLDVMLDRQKLSETHQNDLKPYVKNVKSENMNKGQVKPMKNVKNLTSDLKTRDSSMKVCHSSMKAHDSWNTLSDVSKFSKFSVTRVEERFSR